jgi:hypothetical protein
VRLRGGASEGSRRPIPIVALGLLIDHDHVFILESGKLFRTLHHPQVRWRKSL